MRRLKISLTALLGKEIEQHLVTWILLFGFEALGFAVVLATMATGSTTVSLLQAHAGFLIVLLPLAAIVLGNRLVVTEYYGRTQLFVEALPVRRVEMVATKYGLGLSVLLVLAGLSLGASAMAASLREAIDGALLATVAIRSVAFVFFLWSFLFAMGLVGRLRIPIYCALFLAFGVLEESTSLELTRFGPLALVWGNDLPFARSLPGREVVETMGLGAGALVLAFLLALIHEGSLAETLARRMTQREKAVLGAFVLVFLLAAAVLEERQTKEPFAFGQDEVLVGEREPVEVLYLRPELRRHARALLARLEADLGDLRETMGWDHLPAVRVAYHSFLDGGTYDRARLSESEGILVRANFQPDPEWNDTDFSAYLVGLILDAQTAQRAGFEPKAWLRDGFAQWWSRRREPAGLGCDETSPSLLRALWLTGREGLDEGDLTTWLRYRERHGQAMADAVAYSGWLALDSLHGREALFALARRVFGRRPAQDLRETLHEWHHPMAAVFEQTTQVPWRPFVVSWASELDRMRREPSCGNLLSQVIDARGEIEIEAGEGSLRHVVYEFRFPRPPPEPVLCSFLHLPLSPFDREIEPHQLQRREHLWTGEAPVKRHRLTGRYGHGSRAFLALEVESPVLGCPIRLRARRQEVW